MNEEPLEVIYEDDYLVAVNKPCNMLVHRTHIAEEQSEFVMQKLRDQLQMHVYTIHRLDRPASGVLLFAKSAKMAAALCEQFVEKSVSKTYLAIVRGYFNSNGPLDYPVKNEKGKRCLEAHTRFCCQQQVEVPIAMGAFQTARYSLVEACPETGRWHQIRQHLGHLRHYIIGDKRHGDRHHNRLFATRLDCPFMLLHGRTLRFDHPITAERICIMAPFPAHWLAIAKTLGMDLEAGN